MNKLTAENYTQDKLYPSVAKAIDELLKRQGFVAPVEVLLQTQRLTKQQHDDWRMGRIPFLERAVQGGLGQLNQILRIIELHCRKLELKPSHTVYRKWGKGPKVNLLFSKSGDPNLEAAYSRHYVSPRLKHRANESAAVPAKNSEPDTLESPPTVE